MFAAAAADSHLPLPGAVPVGFVQPSERFVATLVLRRREHDETLPDFTAMAPGETLRGKHLTSEQFEDMFGADPDDIEFVTSALETAGFAVLEVNAVRRRIRVVGTGAQFTQLCGVVLQHFALGSHVYRGHASAAVIPDELASVVTAIVGLDERPGAARASAQHSGVLDTAALVGVHQSTARTAAALQDELVDLGDEAARSTSGDAQAFREIAEATVAGRPSTSELAKDLVALSAASARVQHSVIEASTEYLRGAARAQDAMAKAALLDHYNGLGVHTPPQIAELYDFPADADGAGECVAVIELGGGYDRSTLQEYFDFLDLPMIDIQDVSVGGGANRPEGSEPIVGEVCLDIEVIGGAAPGAKQVVYFAPLTALGFVEAIHTAVHDRDNRPSVISASWDLSEGFWAAAPIYITLMEEALAEAAMLGITVVCSAGDYGTPTTLHTGTAWVDYPASSPHVLGVGGTTLTVRDGKVASEITWNTSLNLGQTTGGGLSVLFPVPEWQSGVSLPDSINPGFPAGRGVPDVAAVSDPTTGYLIQVSRAGTKIICGTSSAAPLWAALIARINQALGERVGYLNPVLYGPGAAEQACNDIVSGNNAFGTYVYSGFNRIPIQAAAGYTAGVGWDATTGWGSPRGTGLLELLSTT